MNPDAVGDVLSRKHSVGKRKLSLPEYTGSALWIIECEIANLHGYLEDHDLESDVHEEIEAAISSLESAHAAVEEAEGWLDSLQPSEEQFLT